MGDQEEDYSSLPLTDRWVHKIWKVRKSAYEDAAKQFERTADESDPAFRPFLQDPGLWKGAVADSNVAAQQEGIAALCAFLKFGGRDQCTRTRGQTITPLVEKGLSSTRAATKASALEAILLYIELDVPGPIIEDLLPALSNKQPKIVAATLAALTAIFHNYGCKTADPKPVLKILPKPFGHADKNVRAEATNLAIEFYRWLREAMKPMFWGDLKPTQQTEMEAQFEKIKSEPAPKQERFLRSQQEQMARAPPPGEDGAEEGEEEGGDDAVEIDAFDLAEPQEVLSKVPGNFSEQLASSKWKERKEAVDALYIIINVPRVKDGDYGEIVRGLAKCMKDANIAVVTQAAQCIEVLAKALRKSFAKYRSIVTGPIMERLKEKKASVADALGAALDQVFLATSLSECLEEVLEFLKHKNPQVKEGTMKFLVRCLRTTRDAPTKQEVASIAESAKKLLSESSEILRSGGAEILGTVMKIMGERAMNPYLEGLDDIRKAKIKEFFDTAEVKAKDKPKAPPPAAPRAAPAGGPKKPATKKPAGAPAKKAPPAAAPAQETLPPQPTAKSAPASKLGSKPAPIATTAAGGLKAPLKRALPGPGGAAPPSGLVSPRRAVAQAPPPVEEIAPPQPQPPRLGLGRGLAGRSLAKPGAPAAPPTSLSMSPPPDSGLTALERAELEELRLDKERLTRQTEELRQERSRLNSEVQELKNQNAQLIEDHTRDVLSIKAKETQLVRARSDCEAAEAMCGQLRREMERLKRALTAAERVNSPPAILTSPTRDINGDDIYRDHGLYGGAGDMTRSNSNPRSRMAYSSTLGDEKENGGDHLTSHYGRSKLSPSIERSGRTSAASNSGRDSPASDLYRSDRLRPGSGMDGNRSEASAQGVESWKRAAEVTSALKAKIELMKAKQARQGISRS
ncbi:armadillo-type protein [Xylogone sp. PMI_703]|nr:armadillo-type protein [Xylogone sp. PMI_703]